MKMEHAKFQTREQSEGKFDTFQQKTDKIRKSKIIEIFINEFAVSKRAF
jgi:hypothetical protein